jgi:hypothetical protein
VAGEADVAGPGYKRLLTSYNRIAEQRVERLAPLSDGVLVVAMTLLVLDLRAPAVEAIHSEVVGDQEADSDCPVTL